MRALWIEILLNACALPYLLSRPVRALWIEMALITRTISARVVEAREGLVD